MTLRQILSDKQRALPVDDRFSLSDNEMEELDNLIKLLEEALGRIDVDAFNVGEGQPPVGVDAELRDFEGRARKAIRAIRQ